MSNLPLIIGISVTLLVLGLTFLIGNWVANRRLARIHRRINGALAAADGPSLGADGGHRWLTGQGLIQLERLAPSFMRDEEVPVLLARAGWRGSQARALFFAVQLLMPVAGILLTLLLVPHEWLVTLDRRIALWLLMASIAGYLLPKFLLRTRAHARQRQLEAEVPTLVHLLRTLFETGLGLEQSLVEICETNPRVLPVLAREIYGVLRNIGAGMDLNQALKEMADDLQVEDLSDLVKMLRQVNRYGGSIRQPLLNYAELLEDRRRTALQERISKLSAKMTIVMVLCMFPALLIFIAGPAAFGILRALGGQ
ncbi:type II secretion system F family protein [Thioalbus denitrificans]|uniref:Tight adherence protein C n=1 Tax=Thioalbus denitrificans TaxID=547122 RepID=A0A369C6Y8_9GAMM|nr:type II secretion system F family protein [Thioalbus denitrificans]RCX29782.1 tight adherence protein C [Thioalbus denitrificans]